jgi:ring-1,2-phenylacetyl-CoA epoxidase subunit PaaE
MSDFTLITKKIISVTNDTKCFYFDVPAGFNYRAGQYITLLLNINGKETRRPYSLCSTSGVDDELCIAVKLIENGEATRYLHDKLKVGNVVNILKPNGRFVLPNKLPKQLFFMAAGSGIGPILGLIKQALFGGDSKVLLAYSNSSKDDCIFYDELNKLAQQFTDRFEIIWLFSNNKNLMKARLNRFMLEEIVTQKVSDKTNVLFYTCGPFVYMEMIFITLLTMDFSQKQLFKETFTTHEDDEDDDGGLIEDNETPEYTDAEVTIVLNNTNYIINLKAGQTILQAAQKNGIELPYSCMRGMCSSCVCQLHSGDVHLHYNQVLTDKDVAEGRVLTCTAHPTTNKVTLTINDF